MTHTRKTFPLSVLILILAGLVSSCSVQNKITEKIAGRFFDGLIHYFHDAPGPQQQLEKVAPGVYSFRVGFDRNLVVLSPRGWLVIDSFNEDFATRLKAALEKQAPGLPVLMLVYSHYHLDHTGGGSVLAPRQVLAHEKTHWYWRNLPEAAVKKILPPTRTLRGDQILRFAGMETPCF